jgi:biopolymer transport protein ExbD/biopolymer transport protein TolR
MKLTRATRLRGAVPVFAGTMTVVLLLVFFLLLSTSFLMQPGLKVELPASRFLLPAMQDPLVVAVTGGPGAAVFFEDRVVEPGQLGARLESRRTVSRQVVIKADREAPLELVSAVTDLALERGFSVALATTRAPAP